MSIRSASRSVAGIPWGAVAIAAIVVGALLLMSPLYGWHRDELYFVIAGRHPALGYVDQPPITPLLTAAAAALLGPSPTSVRILPALVMGALILIAALSARDLGGSSRAQVLAALTVAISGLLAIGHLGATATYDILAWAIVLWLAIRILAGADPRLWLLVGLTAGIALENKHIMLFLGVGLAGGLVIARRWDVIRSRWAWAALGIAILLWLPNLAWQAANGFPQLEMAAAIAENASGERLQAVVEFVFLAGPIVFAVAVAGGGWLTGSPAARPWRALGWAALLVIGLVLLLGGKSYYAVGVLPLLVAAGSIVLDGWLSRGRARVRGGLFAVAATASAALTVVVLLPIVPASSLADTPIPETYKESAEQIGWPELVSAVERTAAALSPEDRARAVIFTDNYGEAGALEVLGRDLPPVYSGHNAYWDWGPPPDDRTVTIVVGGGAVQIGQTVECRRAATIDNGLDVQNQEQGGPIYVCDRVRQPWSQAWPSLRHLD